jgi:hypothetical protein
VLFIPALEGFLREWQQYAYALIDYLARAFLLHGKGWEGRNKTLEVGGADVAREGMCVADVEAA